MLFKIDYLQRSDMSERSKFVNHAADQTEAVTRFMDWFFRANPGDGIKLRRSMEIEMIGDMEGIDLIDEAVAQREGDTRK